jgi:hypothetical protein
VSQQFSSHPTLSSPYIARCAPWHAIQLIWNRCDRGFVAWACLWTCQYSVANMTSTIRPGRKAGGRITMIDREREDAASDSSDEDTLLLGAGADDDSDNNGDGNGWVAVGDFDHLPWWRRPSVR